MLLVVDASVLVAESLRMSGRLLLAHPHLRLLASNVVMNETSYELRRRVESMVARGHLKLEQADATLAIAERTVADAVTVVH